MARSRRNRSGVRPIYTFALCWLFLSAFMPMFRLGTFLLSGGLCGLLSYLIGRSSGKRDQQRDQQKAEEAARKARVEAAQVKPQYTSQRTGQQAGPQYTSDRVGQQARPQQYAQPQKKSYGPEIDPIVEEGNRALSEMGRLYMSIKDPEIKAKINELMRVTDKITQDAIADPSDIPQIKKFMNYYLPTTIKLLNAYDRMSSQGIEGENLDKTMKSINEMLDDAIAAYKKMLDSLFANQALDIETDIAVMNTMLAREGLTGVKDFDIRPVEKPAEKPVEKPAEKPAENPGEGGQVAASGGVAVGSTGITLHL